ncbi:MAG TPA: CHAD domain-containing protein [Blastocatellia bacterium]|nr:CHAD domain-containing protein [Blastocatellia bacterium]
MAEARTALSVAVAPEETPQVINPARKTLEQVILEQCNFLGGLLPAVIEGNDAESIHKVRVTTRRLQAALELAQPIQGAHLQKARRKLRRWRRLLSRVRNYDVFLMLIGLDTAGRKSRDTEALNRLNWELQARRTKRCEAAKRRFARIDLAEFKVGIGLATNVGSNGSGIDSSMAGGDTGLISAVAGIEPEAGIEHEHSGTNALRIVSADAAAESKDVRLVIGEQAPSRLERRLSQLQLLAARVQDDPDPRNAHRLRIAAKRLRYLLEAVSELGYGDAEPALRWLRLLQDRLGDWHDLAALENEILETVSKRKFLASHLDEGLGMLQLASRVRRRREALGAKSFPVHLPRTVSAVTRRLARSIRRDSAN